MSFLQYTHLPPQRLPRAGRSVPQEGNPDGLPPFKKLLSSRKLGGSEERRVLGAVGAQEGRQSFCPGRTRWASSEQGRLATALTTEQVSALVDRGIREPAFLPSGFWNSAQPSPCHGALSSVHTQEAECPWSLPVMPIAPPPNTHPLSVALPPLPHTPVTTKTVNRQCHLPASALRVQTRPPLITVNPVLDQETAVSRDVL